MSDISWFGDSPNESRPDVPWVREYASSMHGKIEPLSVEWLYTCETGYLVFTNEWKGFVFKNSKLFRDLSEVIDDYVNAEILLPRLYASANASGRIALGLKHSEVDATWTHHGKEYSQIYVRAEEFLNGHKKISPTNPLAIPTDGRNASASKRATPKP